MTRYEFRVACDAADIESNVWNVTVWLREYQGSPAGLPWRVVHTECVEGRERYMGPHNTWKAIVRHLAGYR